MLYRAKINGDINVKGCKIVGNGNIFGYELVNTYFVDSSGFGRQEEIALTFPKFLEQVKTGYYYGIKEAGQFQVYIGEYKKVLRAEIFKKNGIASSKLISKSCRVTKYIEDGALTVTLYSTDIFSINYRYNKKIITLNSGGYRTVTTKSRINQFLSGFGYSVYQKNYKWYIDNGTDEHIEFVDGIEIII